jgi:hypothetical protein
MIVQHDPVLGDERTKDTPPQLNEDPSTPLSEDVWVVKSGGSTTGTPLGLLLTLTYEIAGGGASYELRYRTKESITKGVALS